MRRPSLERSGLIVTPGQKLAHLHSLLNAHMGAQTSVILPKTDPFSSEYLAPRDAYIAWLTGFTGSAAVVAVTPESAAIFIDGRYVQQAQRELAASPYAQIRIEETSPLSWLQANLGSTTTLAYVPELTTQSWYQRAQEMFPAPSQPVALKPLPLGFIDRLWSDRPPVETFPWTRMASEYAGQSVAEKIAAVCTQVSRHSPKITHLFLSRGDSVAWLLNLRASEIPYNRTVKAWALLEIATQSVRLCDDFDRTARIAAQDWAEVCVCSESELFAMVSRDSIIGMDPAATTMQVIAQMEQYVPAAPVALEDPCLGLKAIKTPAELAGFRQAHVCEAVAVCQLLAELSLYDAQEQPRNECDVDARLETIRSQHESYLHPSFPSIIGSAGNSAVIHYRAHAATALTLQTGTVLLIDCGGHYRAGTTDMTRTLIVGALTPAGQAQIADPQMRPLKEQYTRVLQSHLAVAMQHFPARTTGAQIDAIARRHFWSVHQDFPHSLGHGVGHELCVHEGPYGLGPRNMQPLEPGMVLSNEPGFYDHVGVRIENLVEVVHADSQTTTERPAQFFRFAPLTLVPYARELILTERLSVQEREAINAYHRTIMATIGDRLEPATLAWLQHACAPLA